MDNPSRVGVCAFSSMALLCSKLGETNELNFWHIFFMWRTPTRYSFESYYSLNIILQASKYSFIIIITTILRHHRVDTLHLFSASYTVVQYLTSSCRVFLFVILNLATMTSSLIYCVRTASSNYVSKISYSILLLIYQRAHNHLCTWKISLFFICCHDGKCFYSLFLWIRLQQWKCNNVSNRWRIG